MKQLKEAVVVEAVRTPIAKSGGKPKTKVKKAHLAMYPRIF